MVESKTSCFFSCSWMIFSSMVLAVMKRTAFTSRVCPILCARWMACSSHAGFHQGSSKKTWFAICKFKPSPPAFREIKMTFSVGSLLKATKASCRACIVMPPRKTTQEIPAFFKRNSTSSNMMPNCEKTIALEVLSPLIIFCTSSSKASTLVLLWNSDALTFCMMCFLPGGFFAAAFGLATLEGVTLSQIARRPCDEVRRCFGCERIGVVAEGFAALFFWPEEEPPAASPFSSAGSSSRSIWSLVKHTGHPTPPDFSFGASFMYSRMQSSWKQWPHFATRHFSSPSSAMSSWQRPQTPLFLHSARVLPLGSLCVLCPPP
mmetsp:Transcript_63580/g.151664  ORF Transcript_63580/g.151664 Transcript_63580/m.151664 type:complete len:319 (-) Transcript_63580:2746-3702(-)